ncbi:IclR family transcriptional regulator [Nocardioides iriomotensis]|uniref:IclR family transcriptional regulator n=1 Tax=Nocardioides iriomotensis TaxID=715784 RepID=A0A4Q5J229_9ACTN|nr:IclR family transcriptional regulator [Nocardioides iriomotensis]RYU12423.1 IclR family transcriptional regulator [Nocardioides iriomotensis]
MSESVRRVVGLLDTLARADEDLTVRELAAQVDVSKSAAQRMLAALVETGLAVQDRSSRRYGLGPLTLVLGTAYQRRIDLRAIASGPMTTLRDLTGETVGLSVRVGDELLHIDQVESRSELRRTFEIGKALPLWAGAPSRVLLSDLPDEEVERIIRAHRPSQVVPVAPPPAEDFIASVRSCRENGWASAFEETIPGVNTMAAPVRRQDASIAATISITGPTSRLEQERVEELVPDLLRVTAEVSRLLGHG